jgi:zinc transport system permease protein
MNETLFLELTRLIGYEFFQHALIGGIIAAFSCALVGLLLILRKEAMIGDGIAHTAFGGIALGLWLEINPIMTALLVSIISTFIISHMRRKQLAQSDAAIAVMLAVGFSFGLIIISYSGGFNVDLFSYLFGSILTIDSEDLLIIGILGIATAVFLGLYYKELLQITFDEESSRLMGLPVNTFSISFNLLVAISIVLSIKVIGMILVVAMLVLPGLSAIQLNLSFKGTAIIAIFFSIFSIIFGIMLSALFDVTASGIIVFTAAAFFLFIVIYNKVK